jgi:hypothetical protein
MSKFVHVDYSNTHAGVERLENAVSFIKSRVSRLDGSRTFVAMVVAAVVAGLLVVANHVIDTITDGHLFAAWLGLWAIGFVAMALIAQPARHLARKLRVAAASWREARRLAAQDAHLWETALRDERVMAEIRAAKSRLA